MNQLRVPINLLPIGEKPRERMIEKGAGSLTNAELIAILLGSGSSRASALDLGNYIVKKFGGLNNLARADFSELLRISGLGPAKATKLTAAFELGRRRMKTPEKNIRYTNPQAMASYLRPLLMDSNREMFIVLYLNSNLNLLGHVKVAEGGLNSVALDPKVVFREAALVNATGIVISHNHPSGNPSPSHSDELVTERILAASLVMDIKLHDHIIITQSGYFSFRDKGMIKKAKNRVLKVKQATKLGTGL